MSIFLQADFWEIAIKLLGSAIAVSGAIIAAQKHFEERRKTNEVALLEAKKPFKLKKQEVFNELLTATSIIGTRDRNEPIWQQACNDFWRLFWGVVPLVADDEVGAAVNHFSEVLDNPKDAVGLRNSSMQLALACRRSLNFE